MQQPLKSYILLMAIILGWNLAGFAQDHRILDSLQTLLKTNIADTTRVNTLNALAWKLKHSNPDTSIRLSNQALELAIEIEHSPDEAIAKAGKKGKGSSFRNLGVFNRLLGNYSLALENYHKALKINVELKDRRRISRTLGNIGVVYRHQGDYPTALEYYFKALLIDEEMSRRKGIASKLGNIGIVYYDLGDFPKALEYYFRALKINEELDHKIRIAINLGNIGVVYWKQGDYSKALNYYFRAVKIAEELEKKNLIANWIGNIGIVYVDQGDSALATGDTAIAMAEMYPKALESYFKALKMREELGAKNLIATVLGNIGSLYTKMIYKKSASAKDMAEKAEKHLLRSVAIADSIGYLKMVKGANRYLSTLYATTGRYQPALAHFKKYSAVKDSLFNEGKSKDLGKLEAKYEFEMAEAERKRVLQVKSQKEKVERARRDNLQYSGIMIFLVILGAGLLALGKLNIPVRLAEGMIFFAFLLFFEFTLVLLDTYIEQYSAGAPAIKLGFNAVLAGLIFPLHSFFESKFKSRLAKPTTAGRHE